MGVLYARNDVMDFVCRIRRSLLRQSRDVASQRMRHARGTIALGGEGGNPNMLSAEEAHGYCVLAMQIDESSSGSGSCPSFIDAIKKITAAMNKDAQCPEKMMSMNQNDIQAESFLTSRSTACEKYSPRSPNGAPL